MLKKGNVSEVTVFKHSCVIQDKVHRTFDVGFVDTYQIGHEKGVNNVFKRLAEDVLNLVCKDRLFDFDCIDGLFFQKKVEFFDFSVCLFFQILKVG